MRMYSRESARHRREREREREREGGEVDSCLHLPLILVFDVGVVVK